MQPQVPNLGRPSLEQRDQAKTDRDAGVSTHTSSHSNPRDSTELLPSSQTSPYPPHSPRSRPGHTPGHHSSQASPVGSQSATHKMVSQTLLHGHISVISGCDQDAIRCTAQKFVAKAHPLRSAYQALLSNWGASFARPQGIHTYPVHTFDGFSRILDIESHFDEGTKGHPPARSRIFPTWPSSHSARHPRSRVQVLFNNLDPYILSGAPCNICKFVQRTTSWQLV